ncbi:LamG domain-containing protein, partial [Candidatus Woesearchaeota archaeon]|nr:LamG domain-containing protein [Candidatus Woesearchaeota archaeon]
MKFTKSLLIMLMILIMSVSVYAACPSNMVSYWKFDQSYDDDFSGTSIDTNHWVTYGGTPSVDGNLDVSGTNTGIKSQGKWYLKGDFDIRVDFLNADFGGTTGTKFVQMLARTDDNKYIRVDRLKSGSTHSYRRVDNSVSWNSGSLTSASGTSGKLRLVRTGSSFNAYFWTGSVWSPLAAPSTVLSSTDDMYVQISVWSNDEANSVSYDNFNIVKGEFVKDSKGSNDGFMSSNSQPTTGKLGNALDFDGSDDYVDLGSNFKFNDQSFSYGGWFNSDDIAVAGRPMGAYSSGGLAIYQIVFGRLPNKISFFLRDAQNDDTGWVDSVGNYNSNTWNHVYVTVDQVNEIAKLYVNGVLDTSADLSAIEDISPVSNLMIGEVFNIFFDGQIDEVAVYNTALTSGQVAELYEASANQNLDYCADFEPTSSFSGTNLALEDDLTDVDLTLSSGATQIKWSNNVNVLAADLDSNVQIGSNFVSINADNLDSSFDTEANVTLTVNSCTNPTIWYANTYQTSFEDIKTNGVPCDGAT